MKTKHLFFFAGFLILAVACNTNKPAPAPVTPAVVENDSLHQKIITARIFVKADKVSDFVNAAKFIMDSSRAESGCISYTLYQDPLEKTNLIFVEVWKDQMAIDNHFSMSYFKNFGPKTKDWLLKPTELKIYDVTPVE